MNSRFPPRVKRRRRRRSSEVVGSRWRAGKLPRPHRIARAGRAERTGTTRLGESSRVESARASGDKTGELNLCAGRVLSPRSCRVESQISSVAHARTQRAVGEKRAHEPHELRADPSRVESSRVESARRQQTKQTRAAPHPTCFILLAQLVEQLARSPTISSHERQLAHNANSRQLKRSASRCEERELF